MRTQQTGIGLCGKLKLDKIGHKVRFESVGKPERILRMPQPIDFCAIWNSGINKAQTACLSVPGKPWVVFCL
jgi:hypothetical protein